jgi:hypothetical protein
LNGGQDTGRQMIEGCGGGHAGQEWYAHATP